MGKISIEVDFKDLKRNIPAFSKKVNRNVALLMDYNAGYTTGWMKQNAPWTDDTAAARTGLTTIPLHLGTTHQLLMAYSVNYGIWLEVANSGKYAIITPAMRIVGEKIMRDMQQLLYGMFGGKK